MHNITSIAPFNNVFHAEKESHRENRALPFEGIATEDHDAALKHQGGQYPPAIYMKYLV